jgi:hypothetical protein
MKHIPYKQLALAVAASFGAVSAFALPPGATTGVTIKAYVGGASAQDGQFQAVAVQLCADTPDVYLIGTGATAGAAGRTVTCTLDQSAFPGGNLNAGNATFALHKVSAGGSANGVFPVNEPTLPASQLEFLTNTSGCVLLSPNLYECNPSLGNVTLTPGAPDAGLSDVEPALFKGANVPAGFTGASDDFSSLTVLSTNQVVFAPIVNTAFRNALQQAQGLTAGAEDVANMPTLSTAQITAMFTGRVNTWDDLLDENGDAMTSSPSISLANLPDSANPKICVRVNGSGTNATFRANIPMQECVVGAPPTLTFSFSSPELVQNSGSGNMDVCVADANLDANTNGQPDRWAIGYNATERNPGPAYARGAYRFVKVDNVAPTSENIVRGIYTYFGEASFQYRGNSTTFQDSGDGADLLEIYATVGANLATPSSLTTTVHEWGNTGNLAITANGFPATPNGGFNAAAPVSPWTKSNASGTNNCLPPRLDNNAIFRVPVVE